MLSIAAHRSDRAYSTPASNECISGNEPDFRTEADLSFLPKPLMTQCRSLIEGYHELHGYACLPDMLWKSGLKQVIESHREFRNLLRTASTTRSAKKSNESFMEIAKTILSLEILASNFSGWSTIYPEAGLKAHALLTQNKQSARMPLMDFYLYPPKYVTSAAIAALLPPLRPHPGDTDLENASAAKPSDTPRSVGVMTGQSAPSATSLHAAAALSA